MKTVKPCLIMPTLTVLITAVALGLAVTNATGAQKQEIPVVVTMVDPAVLPGVRISSDGIRGGSYDQRLDQKLNTFIGLGGQLRFQTGESVNRAIRVDFTGYNPLCVPFTTAQLVKGNIVTLGEDTVSSDGGVAGDGVLSPKQLDPGAQGERLDLMRIPAGESRRAGLVVSWRVGPAQNPAVWKIRWGGGEVTDGAKAGLVTVKCLVFQRSWMIYADDTSNDFAAVGVSGAAPCGVYSMPFCLRVNIP